MIGRDFEVFVAEDFRLQSGVILPQARLAYKTYGRLAADRSNVVVLPTYYTGTHVSNEPLIGAGKALDPADWFIVAPNLFGNGLSSSPSNTPAPYAGADFPGVTVYDNVYCQRRLLQERFGADALALVSGWSVAGMQAFHWAAAYPDSVRAIVPFCSSARCSAHNHLFLEGVKAALTADQSWNGGRYERPPVAGLRAFARVYAGWAFSQTFFREGLYERLGYDSVDALLEDWARDHIENWDANDLLAKIWTWQHADISAHERYGGDFRKALGGIRARAIVMPCRTDLYFPPEDNLREVAHVPHAELRVIDSDWGHCAGGPGRDAQAMASIDQALRDALAG